MEERISQLIGDLSNAAISPKDTLAQLDSLSLHEVGITTDDLISLVDTLTDPYSKLTIGMKNHIIRQYLFFKGKVPTVLVYSICGSLGENVTPDAEKRLPHNLQVSLVNWLICVYGYLERQDDIARLYGVLFNLLEFEFLRPSVAQLLFLATKKKHVVESRINRLVNMYSKDGVASEPIIALALLYQDFKPDMMLNVFPRISHTVFRHPNIRYAEELMDFQRSQGGNVITSIAELREFDEFGKKLKKRKIGSIVVDYSASLNVVHSQNVSNIHDLSLKVETLDIPKDWDTVFLDHTGASLLSFVLKGNAEDHQQFDMWIKMTIESFDRMKYGAQKQFLERLVQYVDLTHDVRTVIIEEFLACNDIISNYPELSTYGWFFFSHLTVKNLDELKIIVKLYNGLFSKMSVEWCAEYLEALATVLITCYNTPGISSTQIQTLSSFFKSTLRLVPEKIKQVQHNRVIGLAVCNLIKHLQFVPEPLLQVQDVVLPPTLIYNLLFNDDPIIFSSICGHLNFAKSVIKTGPSTEEVNQFTNLHNSYVVDVCNLTWRNKALDIAKSSSSSSTFGLSAEFTNSFATTLPIFDRNTNFKSLFNIHHAPTFAAYSANIIRSLEDKDIECTTRHEGPLTNTSMLELLNDPDLRWLQMDPEDIKVEVLKELERFGYVGLADLLFSHLKSLVNKR